MNRRKALTNLIALSFAPMLFRNGLAQTIARSAVILKVAEQFPPNHYISQLGAQAWMQAVDNRTNGRIKFEHFPSQQLARAMDMLDATSQNLADVGYVAFPYFASRMPLISNATYFPVWPDAVVGQKALLPLVVSPGPILDHDFLKNGIRPLMPIANGVFRLWTRDKVVRRPGDMNGLRIRSGGGVQDDIIRAFGGVAVQVPAPEMYEALQRGILDGILMPAASIPSYRIDELVKYCNWGVNVSGGSLGYVINDRVWTRLPEDVRAIMTEEAERALSAIAAAVVERDANHKKTLISKGIQIYDPTESERREWIEAQRPAEDAWVGEMARRGLPGRQVLSALRENVARIMKTGDRDRKADHGR